MRAGGVVDVDEAEVVPEDLEPVLPLAQSVVRPAVRRRPGVVHPPHLLFAPLQAQHAVLTVIADDGHVRHGGGADGKEEEKEGEPGHVGRRREGELRFWRWKGVVFIGRIEKIATESGIKTHRGERYQSCQFWKRKRGERGSRSCDKNSPAALGEQI